MKKLLRVLILGSTMALGLNLQAAIVSVGPNTEEISAFAGTSLDRGDFTSNNVRVIHEQKNLTMPGGLGANAGGGIPAGTLVDTYLVHFDPVGTDPVSTNGGVTFNTVILGILFESDGLISSDSSLGLSGVTYSNNPFRGVEFSNGDIFFVLGSTSTGIISELTFSFGASSQVDDIRVITAASPVPVPAAVWLFTSALIGLVGVNRRKKA